MFITNIFAGTVARVTTAGKVSVFADGPFLAAKPTAIGFTIGPNDITFDRAGTALYVTNIGQNTVVKIEVRGDGAAGSITNFAVGIPTPDGLTFDQRGNLLVASPFTNSIWVVAPDVRPVLFPSTPSETLSEPLNLAFRGRSLYITNLGLGAGAGKISVVTVPVPDEEE